MLINKSHVYKECISRQHHLHVNTYMYIINFNHISIHADLVTAYANINMATKCTVDP
jgi:hypothetical protein